jgi:phage gp36-like protein
MYLTLAQLADAPGALELSQTASESHDAALVDPELFERTLRGQDRTGFDPDAIVAADAAAGRVTNLIAEATALIDGYLARRYTLPLATAPNLLTTWARAIVRYKLHPDRVGDERSDPVVRDYRDALKFLALIADGKFSLGIEDPETSPASDGDIRIDVGRKVFGRGALP